jgi:hypothetical protein
MALEQFHYTTTSGTEIVLPKYKHLKAGLVRRIRKLGPVDQIFTALEEVGTEDDLAVIDEMTQEEMNDFVASWQKDSGVTQGESKASSGS